jgi:hypothetical protein
MTDDLRRQIHEVLGMETPDPALRARVVRTMAAGLRPSSRPRWALAAASAAAIAIAATSVLLVILGRISNAPGPPLEAGAAIGNIPVNSPVGVTCALPVVANGHAATISLASGVVTAFPNHDNPRNVFVNATAYAGGRWLPVLPEAVSPDGRSYAYATITQNPEARLSHARVLIRDVHYGTDREVWSGDGYAEIIGWGVDGLYFVHAPKGLGTGLTDVMVVAGAGRGRVQRVGPNPPFPKDSATGQLPIFTGRDHWISGAGVFTAFGSRPPAPSSNGSSPVAIDTITGMDLHTGSLSTWFKAPAGKTIGMLGLDGAGRPVFTLTDVGSNPSTTPTVQLITAPNQAALIADGSDPAFMPFEAFADSNGLWLSSRLGSVWLYRNGTLTHIADLPQQLFPPGGATAGTQQPLIVHVVGACR